MKITKLGQQSDFFQAKQNATGEKKQQSHAQNGQLLYQFTNVSSHTLQKYNTL